MVKHLKLKMLKHKKFHIILIKFYFFIYIIFKGLINYNKMNGINFLVYYNKLN